MAFIIMSSNVDVWKDEPVKRQAVATLEEMREEVVACMGDSEASIAESYRLEAYSLTNMGGKIGPLPDGTIYNVAEVPDDIIGDIDTYNREHQ